MNNKEAIEFGKSQLEMFGADSKMNEFIQFAIKAIEERPRGKWIVNTGNLYIEPPYLCSECNGSNNWKAPFCEHCGADMRGDV